VALPQHWQHWQHWQCHWQRRRNIVHELSEIWFISLVQL
jgi:hypothetical protein